jgi:hypothetical protein
LNLPQPTPLQLAYVTNGAAYLLGIRWQSFLNTGRIPEVQINSIKKFISITFNGTKQAHIIPKNEAYFQAQKEETLPDRFITR